MQYLFTKNNLTLGSQETEDLYFQFLDQSALSAGIYTLTAGSTDPQKPHLEDEVYYVLAGHSSMRVGQETFEVSTGDVIYVPAHEEHQFFAIESDLRLLVFFSKFAIPKQ